MHSVFHFVNGVVAKLWGNPAKWIIALHVLAFRRKAIDNQRILTAPRSGIDPPKNVKYHDSKEFTPIIRRIKRLLPHPFFSARYVAGDHCRIYFMDLLLFGHLPHQTMDEMSRLVATLFPINKGSMNQVMGHMIAVAQFNHASPEEKEHLPEYVGSSLDYLVDITADFIARIPAKNSEITTEAYRSFEEFLTTSNSFQYRRVIAELSRFHRCFTDKIFDLYKPNHRWIDDDFRVLKPVKDPRLVKLYIGQVHQRTTLASKFVDNLTELVRDIAKSVSSDCLDSLSELSAQEQVDMSSGDFDYYEHKDVDTSAIRSIAAAELKRRSSLPQEETIPASKGEVKSKVRWKCVKCNHQLAAPKEMSGRRIRCLKCKAVMVIPE